MQCPVLVDAWLMVFPDGSESAGKCILRYIVHFVCQTGISDFIITFNDLDDMVLVFVCEHQHVGNVAFRIFPVEIS